MWPSDNLVNLIAVLRSPILDGAIRAFDLGSSSKSSRAQREAHPVDCAEPAVGEKKRRKSI
jgi:hypothetical protein